MPPKPAAPSNRPAAFTLIELLVVIAIIAILAVLALSVTNGMISRSHTTKCASNLRQIGVALNQAIADNNLRIPFAIANPMESYSGGWEIWYKTVAPYLGLPDNITDGAVWNGKRPPGVFACPASKGKIFNAAGQATDYGYNIELHSQLSDGSRRAERLPKIPDPSRVLIIADTQRHSDPSRVGGRDITYYYTADMGTRHGGRSNCLFLDGHVEAIRPSELTEAALKAPGSRFTWPNPWRPTP